MSPDPSVSHQRVSMKLSATFSNFFEQNYCSVFAAPFYVRLFKKNKDDEKITTVVQPDLLRYL